MRVLNAILTLYPILLKLQLTPEQEFEIWKGIIKQLNDICVIDVKV